MLCHGSTGARLFRGLAEGEPTCLTVTIVDGLVLARSQFESSMNYRSAMVLGRCEELKGPARFDALGVLTEHLMPGRGADSRGPSKKELAQTSVLALPIEEWSLKVSDHVDPDDAGGGPRPAVLGRRPAAAPRLGRAARRLGPARRPARAGRTSRPGPTGRT